jgi:hypothetical protein
LKIRSRNFREDFKFTFWKRKEIRNLEKSDRKRRARFLERNLRRKILLRKSL